MKVNVKELIAKRKAGTLTGEEMGRLDLYYISKAYEKAQLGKPDVYSDGRLEREEKDRYIKNFDERNAIDFYNYSKVKYALSNISLYVSFYAQMFESLYFRFFNLLQTAHRAELEYSFDENIPFFINENAEQGETFKALQEQERKKKYSVFDILISHIETLNKDRDEQLKSLTEPLKEKPITNKRILEFINASFFHFKTHDGLIESKVNPMVWQEYMTAEMLVPAKENREKLKSLKKLDILTQAVLWYGPVAIRFIYDKSKHANIITEFKKDYPDIYKYILSKLAEIPLLKGIKRMTHAELLKPMFTGEELAGAGLVHYQELIDNPYIEKYSKVIKLSGNDDLDLLIKQNKRIPNRMFLSESLLSGGTAQIIKDYKAGIAEAISHIFAFKAYVQLMENATGMDYIKVYYTIAIDRIAKRVYYLNQMFYSFYQVDRDGRIPGEMDLETLRNDLRKELPQIDLSLYEIPKQYYSQLKKIFTIETIVNDELSLQLKIQEEIEKRVSKGQ